MVIQQMRKGRSSRPFFYADAGRAGRRNEMNIEKKRQGGHGHDGRTHNSVGAAHFDFADCLDDFRISGFDQKPESERPEMDVGSDHHLAEYYRPDTIFCHREAELLNVLEVRSLSKRFGAEQAVDGLGFELAEGSATALIGPNGAGKTTTLSMLAGLLEATGGEIQRKKNLSIGFLPQYPRFFPWLTAMEFTVMAAKLSGVDPRKARQQAERTLGFVGLAQVADKKIGGFSGGMKQRLGLAQAMVHQPSLLLLDEPISSLDPTGRREVMELLKSLLGQTTILYSTHILNDAEEMTDQLLFLQNGRLVEHGSLDQVRSRYADPQIRIRFENTNAAERFVREAPWPAAVKGAAAIVPVKAEGPIMQDVFRYLSVKSLPVVGVEQETASLEDIFLKVVAEK